MPRFKTDDYDVDWDALENAEYDDTPMVRYEGEDPPVDTILSGYVKSMWMTETKNEDPMIKALFIADSNEGEEEKYNGWAGWENAALIPGAKFRWAPMFAVLGFTLKDVRSKLFVDEDDNVGIPITKIGSFKPGEDSDVAWCRVLIGREKYNGEWQTRIGQWLPWDDEAADADEAEADAADADADAEDEAQVDADAEDEPEEEAPAPPARGRRAAAKPAARTASKPAASPAPSGRTAPARSGRTATTGRAAPAAAKTGRGRRAASAPDDEPPF